MKKLTWKEKQKLQLQPPRIIRKMQAKPVPPHSKAGMGRTSGRTKPEIVNEKTIKRDEQAIRGLSKIHGLLDRAK